MNGRHVMYVVVVSIVQCACVSVKVMCVPPMCASVDTILCVPAYAHGIFAWVYTCSIVYVCICVHYVWYSHVDTLTDARSATELHISHHCHITS